jgi:hypothetical protein
MNKWFCITIGSPDSEPDLLPPLIMLLIRSKGGKITIVYSILRLRQRCIKTLPSKYIRLGTAYYHILTG